MDMNFKQYYQPTNLTTDIHNTNDSNQYTENEQTEFDKSRTNVIVSNHIKEYVPSTIISSTVSSPPIILNQTCNRNYDTINNNTVTKMTTVTNFPRNTTTNPIFNFWRNSTRRSGNWGSRTGTKKSFVWKYFFHPELNLGTKDLTHTQCILCDSLLAFNNSGTTTTMLNHLKSRHGEIVQQEYQQSKKSRCGLLTLKEMNKMTKLNYNLTSNSTKLIDWSNNLITSTSESLKSSSSRPPVPMTLSYTNEHNNPTLLSRRTHRGRPPGSYRHLDYSMANRKFNQIINNNNNNDNYPVKINNSNINKCGEKEGIKETEEINQLQTQIKVNACSPSYRLGNEKEVNTDPISDNTGYFKSFSVISVDNGSTNQHQGVEEFQLLNQKTDESIPSSSPYFINNYPLSCFSPSCEEFHYRLAYFLIRDFHPPRILEEEGFKILIGILWNKFQRINNDINYNVQFNFLPSSKLMENQILNNLYNQLKFNIDNRIKKLVILQQSIENQLLILPQITISLKYWSLNSVNKNQFNNDNLFFEYVDIELNFFINSQYIPKCNHIFYGTYEINKIQTLNEILKPCWNLIYSQFKTNYDYILSEWPIIILTNCLEYTLNAFKESCPISNYLILPYFNVYMKNAVQRALCIPEINEVLTNYQKSLQTLDENVQQMDDLSSESNLKSQSNDQTNINESLSDILDLITRIIPNMDRLPHFTDVDMNLINRIFKSIEIVQEIEKLCKTNYSHFTVSMILPILKNLYSINIEKINDNLSNQFYTTIITYLKTIFNENNILEEFLYISTFLDPRFKNSINQNDYEHILHRLQIKISLLDDYVEKMGLHRKMSYMDEFQYSINDYLNEKSININENPIQWWNDQCDKSEKYYIFKILALYYLTIPLNILNNNNNTNIDDINSPPSDISSPSSDISSNYTQQQNINKLIEQFENSFQNENNSIQINMRKIINVDNNILQDNHISTVISTDYYSIVSTFKLLSQISMTTYKNQLFLPLLLLLLL
uniref:BED-type domain-containing protein n=1 Tax=Schistosoma haematobium TaxID=6185 RepID=A0A094ZNU0_SCHHA